MENFRVEMCQMWIRECSFYKFVNINMVTGYKSVQVMQSNVHKRKNPFFNYASLPSSEALVDEDSFDLSMTVPSFISSETGTCSTVSPPSRQTMRSLSCTFKNVSNITSISFDYTLQLHKKNER